MKPVLAVSMGDPAGIGPEVLLSAAARPGVARACSLVVYGDSAVLAEARSALGMSASAATAIIRVEEVTALRLRGQLPRPSARAGEAAFRYLDAAARAVQLGQHDALVTAPINKQWLNQAGHRYDGHTGYLSQLAGKPATMMLVGRRLRVVLATTHVALCEVSGALDEGALVDKALTSSEHLRRFHGLDRPRMAVAALNPHGGEGGLFGDEENRVIAPAVRRMRRRGLDAIGPLPADTLFAQAAKGNYDVVLCMYHDQALIPLKLLDFGGAVNISMGLPFLRTSPDHGTAYDLAGSGEADAGSMAGAMLMAARMLKSARRKD